ncbi:MAG TPA: TIGR02147 family protein [Polyangiaceae bacterium]|nr:TIGR02147 family protein [Polyangiaceae bacterium]
MVARTRAAKTESEEPEPSVFDYLDYRAFLNDYYLHKKSRGLSYRSISKRVGLKSTNYFKLVMEGKRNLSDEMARQFAAALIDGDPGRDFFVELVRFAQSRTPAQKDGAYKKLSGFRQYRAARPLELAHAEYHSSWYCPVIRELVSSPWFREDPAWLGKMLRPQVAAHEVARAIAVLLETGLLVRNKSGRLKQAEPLVTTGAEARFLHIANYHRMMMQMATEALLNVPQAERDISALTLCVRAEGLARVKHRLQAFRRELLELSAQEQRGDTVLQINFQVFPLTRAVSKEPKT